MKRKNRRCDHRVTVPYFYTGTFGILKKVAIILSHRVDDRCPEVAKIRKLLDFPDRRIKVVVRIMLSSGIA